jgi:hypothetical protein
MTYPIPQHTVPLLPSEAEEMREADMDYANKTMAECISYAEDIGTVLDFHYDDFRETDVGLASNTKTALLRILRELKEAGDSP